MSSGTVAKALQGHAFDAGRNLVELIPDTSSSAIPSPCVPAAPAPSAVVLSPLPEKEYVDMGRAARILATTEETVTMIFRLGLIDVIDYAPKKWKRVRYQSIVDFCDELRRRYSIRDRRPKLDDPMFRHRDADLLPFPIEDTISMKEVAPILGYASVLPVRKMIEEGRFESYQLFQHSPWRISKLSLAAYVEAARKKGRIGASNARLLRSTGWLPCR